MITNDANVKHAMIVGNARPFPILVVQPTDEAFEKFFSKDELREHIWDVVSQVNKHARANGQIAKADHIIITDQDSPLPQTAKTTVNKKGGVKQYENEIEELYKNTKSEDYRDLSKRVDE